MRRPVRTRPVRPPRAETQAAPASPRDRLSMFLGIVTLVCLGATFFLAKGPQFLMPGPLTSAHGAIENCGACHTKTGSGKLSWIHSIAVGDPLADSKACLACHKMPDAAFNAHGVSAQVLKLSTKRLAKVAATTPVPQSAQAQNIAFPIQDVAASGVYCATCHQEHQGVNFNLNKISNEQCRSCHVVKFDSFDGHHPQFDNYPFKRRTRIVYDHASHFGKHFPEIASKDPERKIPNTCATCHTSREDKRVMAVAPFEQTCTGCHLDQIIGKERVSGPKGIAFLTLPGLDLRTLKEKNAAIGEWPEASEAALTPFMKVMIARTEQGRSLMKTLNGVNLQDLSTATDEQIKAVTNLVWEVKGLFYALISGKASDVLADLNIGNGTKLSPSLVADLTASLPRDVVISAHQQWLPELGTEMANRPSTTDQDQSGWNTAITETRLSASVSPEELAGSNAPAPAPRLSPQAAGSQAAKPVRVAQAKAPDQTDDLLDPSASASPAAEPATAPFTTTEDAAEAPKAAAAQPQAAAGRPDAASAKPKADTGGQTAAADTPPQGNAAGQTDDLLFPDGGAPEAAGGNPSPADSAPPSASPTPDAAPADAAPAGGAGPAAGAPQAKPGALITIQSDVDPESWAEYGGWYVQDYAIFYRPTGHKDKFIYSWLFLTGPQAPKGDGSPVAAVFDYLTSKDAQGSCTKCHSVDDTQGKKRLVNFSPPKPATKRGRFTNFIHEPHFGIMENRGCLTCHTLDKASPYLKSFEQGDPKKFTSNFGAVKKDLCQTCHTSSMARQDCLLCHKYHVNDVITPIMNTKIPAR